jgi:hypothetical protein
MVVLLGLALFGEVSVGLGGDQSWSNNMIGIEAYLDPMLEAVQLDIRVRIYSQEDWRGTERVFYLPARVGNLAASLADCGRKTLAKSAASTFRLKAVKTRIFKGGTIPFRQMTSRMLMGSGRSSG